MICNGCQQETFRTRTYIDGQEICDRCSRSSFHTSVPDVYWGNGKSSEMIVDDYGNNIEFTSRSHKASVLARQNLREAGDRFHGTRQGADAIDAPRGTFISNKVKHFKNNPVKIEKTSFKTRRTG